MEASPELCACSSGWKVEGAELPAGSAISLSCRAGTYPGGGARNLSVQAGPGKWRPLLPFAPSCPLPKFTRKFLSRGGGVAGAPPLEQRQSSPRGPGQVASSLLPSWPGPLPLPSLLS